MANLWTNWVEAVRFTCEAQSVISLRLMLIASGSPTLGDEVARMIVEKVDAFIRAEVAASQAIADGCGFAAAVERAFASVQLRVHENRLRLSQTIH